MPSRSYKRMLVPGGCVLAVAIVVLYGVSSHRTRSDPQRNAILAAGAQGICMRFHYGNEWESKWIRRLDAENPTIKIDGDHITNLHYAIGGRRYGVLVGRSPDGKWYFANPDTPSN